MAMIKFKDIADKELKNKIRSVKDLVNYVGKASLKHPNYNILLGSGASYTSGISTGAHLVDDWRKEIYEQYSKSEYFSNIDPDNHETARQRAIEFLIRDHGSWYNPQKEYSSLFERKFDLPAQRRRFVENLVEGYLPSIGYLYLITLINQKYFNTIFTTNFDDLINEAFYQFSNTRPLICAHDSAVNSISLIAQRPKIIKLHGDYLFDDIKNTIKETESLEQNIKEKFIEFTKDNGLIIVGYSGQDRSILDVLNYLLQQEEYLKNGLYWCFRPDDEINHEVRKILWKDKVYCVEIEGFDELFAEFCHHTNEKPNLLNNAYESKRDQCITKFIENFNKTDKKHNLIGEFIEEISNAKNNQDISELIRQINDKQNLSSEKLKSLLEIEALITKQKFDEALEKVGEKIIEEEDIELKENYFSLKFRALIGSKKKLESHKFIDDLIKSDQFNLKYHKWKISLLDNISEKFEYLKATNEKIPHNITIKNQLLSLFIDYKEVFSEVKLFDYLEGVVESSINLDPSLDNDAYDLKIKFLNIKKNFVLKNTNKYKKTQDEILLIDKNIGKTIETIETINKYHVNSILIIKDFHIDNRKITPLIDYVNEIEGMKASFSNKLSIKINNIIAYIYNKIIELREDFIEKPQLHHLDKINKYFIIDDLDVKFNEINFMLSRFRYLSRKFISPSDSILSLNKILSLSNGCDNIKEITKLFSVIGNNEVNTLLLDFINKNKEIITQSDYLYCMYELKASEKNYISSLDFLNKYHAIENFEEDDYTTYSYVLLLAEKYDEVLEFFNLHMNKIENLPRSTSCVIDLNKITAKKMKYGKVDEQDRNLINSIKSKFSENKSILICSDSLLDNNSQAMHHIKELINGDYHFYYKLIEWPAINDNLKQLIDSYIHTIKSKELHSPRIVA